MTLEKRIEKAIAENTDPFTTDADIRFFEAEDFKKELKTFMETLWSAEGMMIKNTGWGEGIIMSTRTTAGVDIEARVFLTDTDEIKLMRGLDLFAEGATIWSPNGELTNG